MSNQAEAITAHHNEYKKWLTPPKRVPVDRETPFMYSGKMSSAKHMDSPKTHDEELELIRKVCRDEPTVKPGVPPKDLKKKFNPIFKHPLPLSVNRSLHEKLLRRVLCMSLYKQAQAAATLGDAWVLEEVYMRGAPVHLADKTGFTPLHMAVNNNNFEAIMVLLNCGVDINATTTSGLTPLYLARAKGATEATKLLEEQGAKLSAEPKSVAPGKTILDLQLDAPTSVIKVASSYVGLPSSHDII
jgi:hypothetical protein